MRMCRQANPSYARARQYSRGLVAPKKWTTPEVSFIVSSSVHLTLKSWQRKTVTQSLNGTMRWWRKRWNCSRRFCSRETSQLVCPANKPLWSLVHWRNQREGKLQDKAVTVNGVTHKWGVSVVLMLQQAEGVCHGIHGRWGFDSRAEGQSSGETKQCPCRVTVKGIVAYMRHRGNIKEVTWMRKSLFAHAKRYRG